MNAVLPIIQYGNPILRKRCAPIEHIDQEVVNLAQVMIKTMEEAHGIGLAAPQIGEDMALMVIGRMDPQTSIMKRPGGEVSYRVEEWTPMMLANPLVTPFGPETSFREGCLSIPNLYGPVVRPSFCHVEGTLADGTRISFEAGGLLARVIQHEYDHLMGLMFFDRMTPEARAKISEAIKAHHAANRPK